MYLVAVEQRPQWSISYVELKNDTQSLKDEEKKATQFSLILLVHEDPDFCFFYIKVSPHKKTFPNKYKYSREMVK